MIRVLVNGSNGKMGQEVIKLISKSSEFYLFGGLDKCKKDNLNYRIYSSITDLKHLNDKPDVIVDFSVPDASLAVLSYAKSIKIPIPYFSQLLADYFDGQEIAAYERKLLTGISKVSLTPVMEQVLSEISKFSQYRGGLGYLYLDGKLLELLSIYLGEVLELDILMGKNISMSRTERTAIMEAKRIIDSQLAFAPSCEELSQQVHLSLTKLTRGFSSFYGMPIHQYIIEQRLIQAAQLLLDGDWNVGEVAAIVGYGKPSNFAAAFKKKYGVAPKHYRETRFNHTKQ